MNRRRPPIYSHPSFSRKRKRFTSPRGSSPPIPSVREYRSAFSRSERMVRDKVTTYFRGFGRPNELGGIVQPCMDRYHSLHDLWTQYWFVSDQLDAIHLKWERRQGRIKKPFSRSQRKGKSKESPVILMAETMRVRILSDKINRLRLKMIDQLELPPTKLVRVFPTTYARVWTELCSIFFDHVFTDAPRK
jgi:hypothetical protein